LLLLKGAEEVRTNKDEATVRRIPNISNHWLCIIHVIHSLYQERMFFIAHRHDALGGKRISSNTYELSNDTASTALYQDWGVD
jgi:hypothetical protein